MRRIERPNNNSFHCTVCGSEASGSEFVIQCLHENCGYTEALAKGQKGESTMSHYKMPKSEALTHIQETSDCPQCRTESLRQGKALMDTSNTKIYCAACDWELQISKAEFQALSQSKALKGEFLW